MVREGYIQTDVGVFPLEWEIAILGDVGDPKMCKRILKEQTKPQGEIPFFKIGTFGGEPDAYISRELFEEFKSRFSYPKAGDILLSAAGTIGRTVIFDGKESYFQDSNIVWIDNSEKKVLNKYLYYVYLATKWKTADGGTVSRLYNYLLKKTVIVIPPLSEQKAIATALSDVDELITNLEKHEIDRSLSSIKAELERRQRLLAAAEVSNISDYYKAKRKNPSLAPLAHLMLVVDEFAELKQQQPEFMNELISADAVSGFI